MHRLNALVVAALATLGGLQLSPAQNFETVYTLPDPGGGPMGSLVKTPNGTFLGTAINGGGAGFGTIFQVTTQGEDDDLNGVGSKSLSVSTTNVVKVTAPVGDTTKVKIDAKTGLFSGTYPDGGTRRVLGGVIYQKGPQHGEGTFFSETTTGKVSIVPVP